MRRSASEAQSRTDRPSSSILARRRKEVAASIAISRHAIDDPPRVATSISSGGTFGDRRRVDRCATPRGREAAGARPVSSLDHPTPRAMIDLYYWTTPNGHKITIFLEEAGLEYALKPVNIGKGEQFSPAFLAIGPNNRIPAIVDHDPPGGGEPLSIMESGAILLYLAGKTGRFYPRALRGRVDVAQWLFWQMAGLGPMAGQAHHFLHYAPEKVAYATDRYVRETARLYGVLNKRLADREFIAGDYSIADMACYPWVLPERQQQDMANFPHLARWKDAIAQRPAVKRAYALVQKVNPNAGKPPTSEQERKVLFGQDRTTVR